MMTVKPACLRRRWPPVSGAWRGLDDRHAARLPQRVAKSASARPGLPLRVALHGHQIVDGLTAALFALFRESVGGGFRADGLPDELQYMRRALSASSASVATASARAAAARRAATACQINRQREQRQRADRAHDEISVSCPLFAACERAMAVLLLAESR